MIDKPLRSNSGQGKLVWEFVRDALGIPATAKSAVVTFSADDVIRVQVEYVPVEQASDDPSRQT